MNATISAKNVALRFGAPIARQARNWAGHTHYNRKPQRMQPFAPAPRLVLAGVQLLADAISDDAPRGQVRRLARTCALIIARLTPAQRGEVNEVWRDLDDDLTRTALDLVESELRPKR